MTSPHSQKNDAPLQTLKQKLTDHPDSEKLLLQLGQRCFEQGNLDEANGHLKKLLELDPDHMEGLSLSSRLCREAGLLGEAETFLNHLVESHPANSEGWYDLGNILRDQRKMKEALTAFERVLELNPEDTRARHLIAVLKGDNPESPPDAYIHSLFNPYASRFDDHLVHRLHYNAPENLARLTRKLKGDAPRFEKALDLGCGTGLSGLAFRSQTKHLTGVDLAPNMLERAQAKGVYDQLEKDSIDHFLTNTNELFDLFIATDVFIYLGAVESLFVQVAKQSRPGAWFAFSTESVEGPDFEALPSGRYAHSMFYIQRLADQHRFEVAACQNTDIREEYGKGVPGHLFVLKLKSI